MLDRPRWFGGMLLLTSVPLAAQSVWVVDAAGGAGSSFTSIASAIGSPLVANDDTLLIRPGRYGSFTLQRPLRILCPSVAFVDVPLTLPALSYGITVSGIPANQRVVIEGIEFQHSGHPGDSGAIKIESCAGEVHLNRLRVPYGYSASRSSYPELSIVNCQAVTCSRVELLNGYGIAIRNSSVTLAQCQVYGGPGSSLASKPASPALSLVDATVDLTDCNLYGGSGANFPGITLPAFAVSMISQQRPCEVLSRAMLGCHLEGGYDALQGRIGVLESIGVGCTFAFTPNLTITTGAPIVTGPVRLLPVASPALVADDNGAGSVLWRVRGDANQSGLVLFSPAARSVIFGVPGWVDPLVGFSIGVTLSATGRLDLRYALPVRDYRTTLAAQWFPLGFPALPASNSALWMF